ncbi:MAG TPA: SpoIIE family protein phosphatase [Ktedonobacteraceae bacterium]|nr:SpoIIE family protein phosphatase [Ktedonobacteraceae bacterium]
MATFLQNFQQRRFGRAKRDAEAVQKSAMIPHSRAIEIPHFDIAPNDPLVAYFLSAPGAVEIDKLRVNSPALDALQAAGVKMVIPLISQGELVGLLNLGPRLSEQDFSADDRTLLNDLATQAAPALRVAQLVRERRAQDLERERLEQELRVARLIQQTLLPKELPALPGWHISSYYQPARAVGGDFYDFLYFEDGRVGIVIGDVTDKGVPAALVMATTRSILRSTARADLSPGKVLEQTNELLHNDIPPKMFVTCLYAILDPVSGRLEYANAGHDLPYVRHGDTVSELRATGMPLGLMPGMTYEEKELLLAPGDGILFYSDGLVEAHNSKREMFGFPHLRELLGEDLAGVPVIDFLLAELATFTGEGWEQEDDVTLVTLRRNEEPGLQALNPGEAGRTESAENGNHQHWRTLGEFLLPSVRGNERQAMEQVAKLVEEQHLPTQRLERLKTAVAEATMNAMEHGNHYSAEIPVIIQVRASGTAVAVRITDQGEGPAEIEAETPDLEAKLEGLQTPRGWGLFLIKNLVDEMYIINTDAHHTVELIINLEEGGSHASSKS